MYENGARDPQAEALQQHMLYAGAQSPMSMKQLQAQKRMRKGGVLPAAAQQQQQ